MASSSSTSPPSDAGLSNFMRDVRHNPCLMSPVAAFILLLLALFTFITMIIRIPEFLLGFLLSPLLDRSNWFIEFLYPSALARWGHLFLVRMGSKKKKASTHSSTTQQRFELVPGRLFIHPIPQLLDNLAYLVVSVKPSAPTVAFIVDCGDARSAAKQIEEISDLHYSKEEIRVQMVLSTHKHHDHTAGNRGLFSHRKVGRHMKTVVGGAVEKVPYCNKKVADGDLVELPSVDGNDMNDIATVEVIAVPGHTRGSVAYQMRCRGGTTRGPFLFTGDTMFSGGGGVPFEADFEKSEGKKTSKARKVTDFIRPSAGGNAVEKCFAELLVRSHHDTSIDGVLIFPGHEYSSELLNRQMQGSSHDATDWTKQTPSVYFRTVSQLYMALHRRSIPHGKLLTIPSPLTLELDINPHFRKMKKRGQELVRALRLWYRHFSRGEIPENEVVIRVNTGNLNGTDSVDNDQKTPASEDIWNVGVEDVSRSVFTTVYTADLDQVIRKLADGEIDPKAASEKLQELKKGLEAPVIGRRPIPATLPTDKVMYNAAVAFALLGSSPWGLTKGDSVAMNLLPPLSPRMTNQIQVSKSRIVALLDILRVPTDEKEKWEIYHMIQLLWKEIFDYGAKLYSKGKSSDDARTEENGSNDVVELGVIKWMLFGIEARQPSWFSKYCMPCGCGPKVSGEHPIASLNLRRTNGELVRHDVLTCPICRDAAGCPILEAATEVAPAPDGANGEDPLDEVLLSPESRPDSNSVSDLQPVQSIRLQYVPSLPGGLTQRSRSDVPFDESESVELEMIK